MDTLTQGVISREDALKISPDYVRYAEGDFDLYEKIYAKFSKLKKGQRVLTFSDRKFVLAKVTSINSNDFRAVDGPVVRVSNGEYSWRVDGDGYAYPVNKA